VLDNSLWLRRWAEDNECLLNPGFMRSTCVKACRVAFACGDDFLVRASISDMDIVLPFQAILCTKRYHPDPCAEVSEFDGLRDYRGDKGVLEQVPGPVYASSCGDALQI